MESWDDGVNTNWEGNVYVQQLSSGDWVSANEQKETPAEPFDVNWTDPVGTNMQPRNDCRKTGSACGYCGTPTAAECNLRMGIEDNWTWCVGTAGACAFLAGPAWPACIGIGCYGAFLAGFLNRTKQHFQNCWLDAAERTACGG